MAVLSCRHSRRTDVLAVGEDPANLIVYAALGKAARDWPSHDKIIETLKTMAEGETLIVQSGKPIGLLKTHDKAPIAIWTAFTLTPLDVADRVCVLSSGTEVFQGSVAEARAADSLFAAFLGTSHEPNPESRAVTRMVRDDDAFFAFLCKQNWPEYSEALSVFGAAACLDPRASPIYAHEHCRGVGQPWHTFRKPSATSSSAIRSKLRNGLSTLSRTSRRNSSSGCRQPN